MIGACKFFNAKYGNLEADKQDEWAVLHRGSGRSRRAGGWRRTNTVVALTVLVGSLSFVLDRAPSACQSQLSGLRGK